MKVLIVDDHMVVRQGLISILSSQPDIKIVGEAGSLNEALSKTHLFQPDVILMDYGLPDGNGVEATRAILADKPDTKIIFLTVHDDDETLFAALRAGAKGFLLKSTSLSRVVDSIRAIARNEAILSPEMTSRLIDEFSKEETAKGAEQSPLNMLTLRELDILQELATYASDAEIAARLSLSVKTIKNHVHSILGKLQMKNRREAAWFAQEHGFGPGIKKPR